MRQVLLVAGDAEVEVDLVVVGLDVGVGDRPVFAEAIVGLALEVVVGEPQRQAPPDIGLAAEQARAHPGVLGAGIRMLLLVDQDVLDVVRAAPAAHIREHVLERRALSVGRLADVVLVEADRVVFGRGLAAARMVVGPLHRPQFGIDVDLLPRFEQQHLHPLRREHVSGHPARRAGAYDDRIVGDGQVGILLLRGFEANQRHEAPSFLLPRCYRVITCCS